MFFFSFENSVAFKYGFFAFARNRVFPAIVFSAVSCSLHFSVCYFFLRNQLVCLIAFSCSLASLTAKLISLALVFLVVASCSHSCHNIGRFFRGVVLPAGFRASTPITFFSSVCFFCQPCGLTIRALDGWFCGGLLAFFWLRFFLHLKQFPHHPPVTQTVSPQP